MVLAARCWLTMVPVAQNVMRNVIITSGPPKENCVSSFVVLRDMLLFFSFGVWPSKFLKLTWTLHSSLGRSIFMHLAIYEGCLQINKKKPSMWFLCDNLSNGFSTFVILHQLTLEWLCMCTNEMYALSRFQAAKSAGPWERHHHKSSVQKLCIYHLMTPDGVICYWILRA